MYWIHGIRLRYDVNDTLYADKLTREANVPELYAEIVRCQARPL